MAVEDKDQIKALWDDEIKQDSKYIDSFEGLECTMADPAIKFAPHISEDRQERVDRINIQIGIVHRAWDKARDRYYKIKYPGWRE